MVRTRGVRVDTAALLQLKTPKTPKTPRKVNNPTTPSTSKGKPKETRNDEAQVKISTNSPRLVLDRCATPVARKTKSPPATPRTRGKRIDTLALIGSKTKKAKTSAVKKAVEMTPVELTAVSAPRTRHKKIDVLAMLGSKKRPTPLTTSTPLPGGSGKRKASASPETPKQQRSDGFVTKRRGGVNATAVEPIREASVIISPLKMPVSAQVRRPPRRNLKLDTQNGGRKKFFATPRVVATPADGLELKKGVPVVRALSRRVINMSPKAKAAAPREAESEEEDGDVYEFAALSQESTPAPEDPYIKELIKKLKKRKPRKPRRKNVEKVLPAAVVAPPAVAKKPLNKTEEIMEKIRKRIADNRPVVEIVEEEPLQPLIVDEEEVLPPPPTPANSSIISRTSLNFSPHQASSPWRVVQSRAPRIAYFSFSHDLLPSYSSDVIPAEQQPPPTPIAPITTPRPSTSSSSSSLNPSDMENITPPSHVPKATPAPRDPNRTPLRPLDVQPHQHDKDLRVQVLSNITLRNRYRLVNDRLVESDPDDSLFGFGDDDDQDTEEESAPPEPKRRVSRDALREKLLELRKLLPPKEERRRSSGEYHVPGTLFKSPTKPQPSVSTMFAERRSVLREKSVHHYDEDDVEFDVEEDTSEYEDTHAPLEETSQQEEIPVKLFDDPEPELKVTQTKEKGRRSYGKRQNRKQANLKDLLTSDDDEEEPVSKRKRTKQRKKRTVEQTTEFKQFVSEFNSMCEEVEQFELVVE